MADHIHNIAGHSVVISAVPGFAGAILTPSGEDDWIDITPPVLSESYDDNNGDNVESVNPVRTAEATITCGEYSECYRQLSGLLAAQRAAIRLRIPWTKPNFRYFNPDNGTVTTALGVFVVERPNTGGARKSAERTFKLRLTKYDILDATLLTGVP
jgi:hypothetical protein